MTDAAQRHPGDGAPDPTARAADEHVDPAAAAPQVGSARRTVPDPCGVRRKDSNTVTRRSKMATWVFASPQGVATTGRSSPSCRSMRHSPRTGRSFPPAPRRPCSKRCSPSGGIAWTATSRPERPRWWRPMTVGSSGSWSPGPTSSDRTVVMSPASTSPRIDGGRASGGRLYVAALGRLRQAQFREATLWVLEHNVRARAWYERLGWRSTGERKTVYEPAGIVDLQYMIRLADHPSTPSTVSIVPHARLEHRVDDRGAVGGHGRRPVGVSPAGPVRRPRIGGRAVPGCARVAGTAVRAAPPPRTAGHRQDEPARDVRRARDRRRRDRAFVWTGATSSRRRRRCCTSWSRCSRCPAGRAIAGPPGGGRVVLLFDTYERLAPLDDWVRTVLLPRLPADARHGDRRPGTTRPGLARRPGVARAVAGGLAAQPEPGGQPHVPARLWRRSRPSRPAGRAGPRPPVGALAVGRRGRPRRRSLAPIRCRRTSSPRCCDGSSRSSPAASTAAPWRRAPSPG